MAKEAYIRRGQSCALDARAAVREFHAAVLQPDTELVVFFCSAEYDLDALADEMSAVFGTTQVVGCTAAGEIGPAGYLERSLTGASFAADGFVAVSGVLEDLSHFDIGRSRPLVDQLLVSLADRAPAASHDNSFALQLIDGLSGREEPVTRAFQHALGGLPLVGGSAADGLSFDRARVYFEGRFRPDSAVLVLVSTPLPFRAFMTQHFVASDDRLVVTEADPARRIVREIDGLPASAAYAERVGVDVANLDSTRFATSPMVVVIGGMSYVRSISRAQPDGALKFFCAIDEGVVLRIARSGDLIADLERTLTAICADIGLPQLIIGCDCILRCLEARRSGSFRRLAGLLAQHQVTGFATYGEQYCGVHLNQTFTGIAIGSGSEGGHGD